MPSDTKTKTAITLLLVFFFVLVSLPEIRIVKADGTIYIRSDGSVVGTDKIQREGDVYTFTDNINGSVVVEKDNIVVDGARHTISLTTTAKGIILSGRDNVTITNMKITGSNLILNATNVGIELIDCKNIQIVENTIEQTKHALTVNQSTFNRVFENNLTQNYWAVYLYQSFNNSIVGNNIKDNDTWGVSLRASSNNRTVSNNIVNNWVGAGFDMSSNNFIQQNNFIDNTWHVANSGSNNIWDDECKENFWSDYAGLDNNLDGIGDTPYPIDNYNQDNYPLIELVIIPEFPSWIILPLLITVTLMIIICKRRLPKSSSI